MVRLFDTHHIRPHRELSGMWGFTPLDGPAESVNTQAAVPGCWECIPGFETYRGEADYTTAFETEGNIRLEFKGVSHTATVYLDDRELGSHYNAYTPFSFVATGLKAGQHHLRVRVSNAFGPQSALHIPNDYYSYGGISRPVILEKVSDCFLQYLHATPLKNEDEWRLELQILVHNCSAAPHPVAVNVRLGDAVCQLKHSTVPAGESVVLCGVLPCPGVQAYEPDAPKLYDLTAELAMEDATVCDDLVERVGFRQISIEGNRLLFNGKPLKIKGFNRHEDHPLFGCAIPFQAMCQDLKLMQDLGANAVRTCHYPNDELFLDLCDEMGILVWEENHGRGLKEEQMRNGNFRRQCEDCNREMILSHYNHPSIYIWGILNECASETEYGRACYAEQFAQLRAMDTSRPVSFASCKHYKDMCLDLVDVVSFNIYPEWYVDADPDAFFEALFKWVQTDTQGAGKPFLVTEIGAGGIYGCRGPAHAKWSEERQADILEKQLTALLSNENLAGVYIWQFCDCRVSESWWERRPRSMNNKGVVDEYRRPKLAYAKVKQVFERI